jgi:L-threonylcarbamoyladenylate synthase
MVRLSVSATDPDPEMIRVAAAHIAAGGVVAFPTDTLYGLGADPQNASAVQKVFAIKGRRDDNPLPLIAASTEAAEQAGRLTVLAHRLARRFWPGPLTLVVPVQAQIAREVHQGTNKIGIRVPGHVVARALALASGGVLTATSANPSGRPPSNDPEEVALLATDGLDALLDAGYSRGGPPSTIVDVSGEWPVLLREGAVPWDRVLEFLGGGPSTA